MLKQTEKHKALLLLFLSLVAFQLGWGRAFCHHPFGYAYGEVLGAQKPRHQKFHLSLASKTIIDLAA